MKNIFAIIKKELKHFFYSPLGYIILAVFLFISSFFFRDSLHSYLEMSIVAQNPMGEAQALSINQMLFGSFLWVSALVLIFIVPIITMRIVAEERKSGTFELLSTSPIRNFELILGKFLSQIIIFIVLLLSMSPYFISIYMIQRFAIIPLLVGILGYFLFGAACLAVGFFFSSIFKNPIHSAVSTLGMLLILWISRWFGQITEGFTGKMFSEVSIITHIDSFMKGIISIKDISFFISFIFFMLLLSNLYIDSIRWRE